ncbi:MAG: SRPBCC family protein [Synergistaceae bacterium]|nr:SRPBCC family protein [Synergistaceae bacterium]
MATSNTKATFPCDIHRVWEVVTSLEQYSWRSDINSVEIISEHQFIEHTKDGYATTFTVTAKEPYKRWEFDMENENIKGHWTGIFTQKNGQTEVDFTEDVTAKKILIKPFVKSYLKKQQATYIQDLSKELEKYCEQ